MKINILVILDDLETQYRDPTLTPASRKERKGNERKQGAVQHFAVKEQKASRQSRS